MKSFFTFFDRSYGYSRAIISAIIGLVLVIWPDTAVKSIVIVIGAALLLLGAVTMIFSKRPEEDRNRSILSINGAITLIFGLVLVVFPAFFVGIIMFLFGAILLIVGISEVAALLSARNELSAIFALNLRAILILGSLQDIIYTRLQARFFEQLFEKHLAPIALNLRVTFEG